jgi:ankyrin repeat protein
VSQLGLTSAVRLLLDHNADVSMRDGDGDNALQCAVFGGAQLEVVQLLLDFNAEINSRNNDGSTPLHHASRTNSGVVRLLLNYGADAQARNCFGMNAIDGVRHLLSQHVTE